MEYKDSVIQVFLVFFFHKGSLYLNEKKVVTFDFRGMSKKHLVRHFVLIYVEVIFSIISSALW